MSLRTHHDIPGEEATRARGPEIHHPRPTRPAALQPRVTIANEEKYQTWRHYVPASAVPSSETAEQSDSHATTATSIQRSPSAPPAVNQPTSPVTTIHSILTAAPAIRGSGRRMRFTWDVGYSPDAPPAPIPTPAPSASRRNSTVSGTYGIQARPLRPRSNTQPSSDHPTAFDMHTRPNPSSNSQPPTPVDGQQPFATHPVALEPATTPPRPRMLIVCRDLLPWLIPVYACDPSVGCTVLDVVRGIYAALQTKVEVAARMRSGSDDRGHARSASDGTRERRRIEWLRDKTVFVCIGRDEALVKRRLPGRMNLWEETFVLTLARRRA